MTALSITQLLNQHQIYFPSDDGLIHLIGVMDHAATLGQLPELTRMFNYIAPNPDEVILMWRDGRSEEYSFFWKQITRAEHQAALRAIGIDLAAALRCGWVPVRTDYQVPSRNCYHGGLVYRPTNEPATWTVHT